MPRDVLPPSAYRSLYARLLRLYPKAYRERFGEGMEQTFRDVLRERAFAGGGAYGFVLSAFADTCVGILKERISSLSHHPMHKNILRLAVGTALVLLIPLALTIRDGNVPNVGWNWSPFDFVFAFALIFGTGLAFLLTTRNSPSLQYRIAAGLGLLVAFLLVWVNGAVGIIGNEDNPLNLLYFGVIAVGFFGAILSRLRPRGLSNAMFAAAAVQLAVPAVAFAVARPVLSEPPGMAGVLAINAFLAMLLAGSGLLFRQSAEERTAAVAR